MVDQRLYTRRRCMFKTFASSCDRADRSDSASPTNFFIYRTARIILVPAVTDQDGHLTCATTSTFYPSTFGVAQSSILFPGINSNAENYFEGSTATKTAAARVVTDISLSTPYLDRLSTAATATNVNLPSTGAFTQSGFDGLRGQNAAGQPTSNDDTTESDYGYVDPFFIKFLAQRPDYLRQYPGLAGCLPGGPSIDPGTRHADLVSTPTLATALTGSTSSTTYVSGCFNPGSDLCATAAPPPPPSAVPEVAPQPPPTPQPVSQAPPAPPSSAPAPLSPTAPAFNPNSLSPSQLSQLLVALEPSSAPGAPASPVSPPPPAPPSSLETSISPPGVPSSPPPRETTPSVAVAAPSTIVSSPSATVATPSTATFSGEAVQEKRLPQWNIFALLCIGWWVFAVV